MPRERVRALSHRGTRTVVNLANDYAYTYAPFIQAAVTEVGHNYRQVAKPLTRERIPAQRNGHWKAQSVKNLVVRYWRLTGRRLLIPYKRFPQPAHRHNTNLRSAFGRLADVSSNSFSLPLCANSGRSSLATFARSDEADVEAA